MFDRNEVLNDLKTRHFAGQEVFTIGLTKNGWEDMNDVDDIVDGFTLRGLSFALVLNGESRLFPLFDCFEDAIKTIDCFIRDFVCPDMRYR
jgi:hypothetical protein